MYNDKWVARDSKLSINDGGYVPIIWNKNKFVTRYLGFRKLQTLRIIKLIKKLNQKSFGYEGKWKR